MWEAIVSLAKTPAAVALVAGIVGLLFYMVRKGMLSFKGKGVTVGLSEQGTRNLIQSQFEFAEAKCESMILRLPKDLDKWRTRYIVGKVEDVVQRSIIFNNIRDSEEYIKGKQELIYNVILKYVEKEYFLTEEFKAMVFKFVNDLYKDLYRMKRIYKEEE